MDIPDHIMPRIPGNPLDALADNGWTQMSHMERLGHIRPAVIHNNSGRILRHFQAKLFFPAHSGQIVLHEALPYLQIQKARGHSLHAGENLTVFTLFRHIIRNHNRCFFINFCPRHGAVTLIFTQIRPVGRGHLPKCLVIPCRPKCALHFL